MISLDFKKIISYFKGHKEREIFDRSLRDWKRLIVVFFALMLLLCLADGYIYIKSMSSEEDSTFVGDEKFETVNRTLLLEVVENLNDKEVRMIEKFSAPDLEDPSI